MHRLQNKGDTPNGFISTTKWLAPCYTKTWTVLQLNRRVIWLRLSGLNWVVCLATTTFLKTASEMFSYITQYKFHTHTRTPSHNIHFSHLIGNNHTKISAHLRQLAKYNLKTFHEKMLIEFIITHCRDNTCSIEGGTTSPSFRNADRSSAESRAIVPKFIATDDGRVGRNSGEF